MMGVPSGPSASDLVALHMGAEAFDAHLAAFASGNIGVRPWPNRAALGGVTVSDVSGDLPAYVRMLRAAGEIEEPWMGYTAESVAYFELGGLPRLAHFMQHTWAGDERRHGAVLRRLLVELTGELPDGNPHYVAPVLCGGDALERHLFVRLNAELGAAATYTVLASRGRGALHAALVGLAGDEYRHLSLFWAAVAHRCGSLSPLRAARLMQTTLASAAGHRTHRTGLDRLTRADAVLLREVAGALVQIVGRLLEWDRTLSPELLTRVFVGDEVVDRHAAALRREKVSA